MTTKKKITKKTATKKSPVTKTKEVTNSETPNINRTFKDGKMIVTFNNGRTREITIVELEKRLANVPTMIKNRTEQREKMVKRITENISKEKDDDIRKAIMQLRLENIQKQKLPTEKELTERLQGWIDSCKSSI